MPEGENHWMRFVGVALNLLKWLEEAEGGGYNDVVGDNDKIGLLAPPLEVMFSGYLNRRGEGKRKRYDGLVVGNVEELSGSKAFVLKGSKLLIRPPVL